MLVSPRWIGEKHHVKSKSWRLGPIVTLLVVLSDKKVMSTAASARLHRKRCSRSLRNESASVYVSRMKRLMIVIALLFPVIARAHCDALDGPVILAARTALEKKDVTPLLKWVRPEDETQIRDAFNRALAVREIGGEAKTLADTWFFETFVRVHRAGEGEPFTGIKPAGGIMAPIVEADHALDEGSVDKLATMLADHTAKGLRQRYANVVKAKAHANDSVAAGREYVEAYVQYVHYVESVAKVVHGEMHAH